MGYVEVCDGGGRVWRSTAFGRSPLPRCSQPARWGCKYGVRGMTIGSTAAWQLATSTSATAEAAAFSTYAAPLLRRVLLGGRLSPPLRQPDAAAEQRRPRSPFRRWWWCWNMDAACGQWRFESVCTQLDALWINPRLHGHRKLIRLAVFAQQRSHQFGVSQ